MLAHRGAFGSWAQPRRRAERYTAAREAAKRARFSGTMIAVPMGRQRWTGLALAGALALGVIGCRSSHAASETDAGEIAEPRAPYVATREAVSSFTEALMEADQIAGLSLALVDGDEVVWATGFGMADVEDKRPATPRTVYHVGSLTKPVTAAAILQAVERGQLRLDQTLAELVPELRLADGAEQRITLDQLLTHQSGLPSDWFIHSLSDEPPPWTEIPAEIAGLALAAEPGAHTIYSNLGMTLAGIALARATGARYEDHVSASLLRPAGMRTAHFLAGPEPEPVLLPIVGGPQGLDAIEQAASYRGGERRHDPQFRMVPAGGLRASVLDLAAFARLCLNEGKVGGRQLLAPSSVAAMLSAHNHGLALDLDHQFGYAWFLDHAGLDYAGEVAWHGGRTLYHHARIMMLPGHDLAVVVASNSLGAANVVDAVAVETLVWALQEKAGVEPPSPATTRDYQPPAPELAEAWAAAHGGDYATSVGVSQIGLDDGELWSKTRVGASRLGLRPDGDAELELLPDARVRFVEADGRQLMAIERRGRTRPTGVRLDPPAPLSEAWRAREGRWTLVTRPGEVSTLREPELRIVNGRMRLEFLGLLEAPPLFVAMVLDPIDDRHAVIEGIGRGQGVRVEIRGAGEDERLWWAGREFRRGS